MPQRVVFQRKIYRWCRIDQSLTIPFYQVLFKRKYIFFKVTLYCSKIVAYILKFVIFTQYKNFKILGLKRRVQYAKYVLQLFKSTNSFTLSFPIKHIFGREFT